MKIYAKLKNAPISAQKCRLVAALIKKKNIIKAINILRFTSKKASSLLLKVLESAIANAENNYGLDIDSLTISSVYIDEGKKLKRISPRAKGRINYICKRTCHIIVQLEN